MIPATIIAAANAYGLFLLIASLGHGLVNVPRGLWRSAHTQLNLKRWRFEIAQLDIKLREAQESLDRSMRVFIHSFPSFFLSVAICINMGVRGTSC